MIMTNYPNPQSIFLDVVQEMIGKPVKIAAPEPTGIEMEKPWIRARLLDTDLELRKEVLTQLFGNSVILCENLVQVRLDAPVKPS